jgi:hypothetical protein
MSMTLKDVTETTVQAVTGFVGEAKDRIGDIQVPDVHVADIQHLAEELVARVPRRMPSTRTLLIGAGALAGGAAIVWLRRNRRNAAERAASSPSPYFTTADVAASAAA